MAMTFASKFSGTVGHIILAWLLTRSDFGLIGLAYSVTGFAELVQNIGLREILIHRASQYRRWANAAFWMAIFSGLAAGSFMAALAPIAAEIFDNARVTGLVFVLALAAPLMALNNVPLAKLQSQMRFRLIAGIGVGTNLGQMTLCILLAWWGMGAYSFVIPRPLMALITLAVSWWAASPPIRWDLQVRRWRYLVTDSVKIFVGNIFVRITEYGDYIILGIFHPEEVVGIYFFAFNLSTQTLKLFTRNFKRVIFPALSSVQDEPARQVRAFLQTSRLLAFIGVPLCQLQAALSDPAVHLFFREDWHGVIPVLQILSLGMMFRVVGFSGSLLNAQGRFGTKLVTNIIYGVTFLGMVAFGGWIGQEVAVACMVVVYLTITIPTHMYIAIRPGGGRWRDIWDVFSKPIMIGGLTVGMVTLAGSFWPKTPIGQIMKILFITGISSMIYIIVMRQLAQEDWDVMVKRCQRLLMNRLSR